MIMQAKGKLRTPNEFGFLVGAFSALLFGSVANAESYSCVFEPSGVKTYFPRTVTVDVIDGEAKAWVRNSVVSANYGDFIIATISADNAKRTTVKWVLIGLPSDPRYAGSFVPPSFQYLLTILKPKLTARLNATNLNIIGAGYGNDAAGTCVLKP